jgi:carboxypeptidase C (cathepsin A)
LTPRALPIQSGDIDVLPLRSFVCTAVLLLNAAFYSVASAGTLPPMLIPGDEPVVVTLHSIRTPQGPLRYEARAGRLPIRDGQTGEVKGHVFFVAYIALNRGTDRPLAFAWNGGPIAPSIRLHMQLLGPRRLTKQGFLDNAETLLAKTDIVFYDPVETGFSRPEKPESVPELLNMQGDIAEAAEFIRAYRARFGAGDRPLFVIGESYGVWRACAVSEILAKRGDKLDGVVLISGDLPGVPMPLAFYDAMHIPARTAIAYFYHRLPPELMQDRDASMKAVNAWVTSTYLPALLRPEQLSDADREKIAQDLARFTGLRPDQVDRQILVVSISEFLRGFFGGEKTLDDEDARLLKSDTRDPASGKHIGRYLRGELGYTTDLTYSGSEKDGYTPTPGPGPKKMFSQWTYNEEGASPEIIAKLIAAMDPKYIASTMPSWLENAMRIDPDMKVFVATGRFDPLNMCEGDEIMRGKLEANLSNRVSIHCYEGGHMMYRDEQTRLQLSHDLAEFVGLSSRSQ